MKKLCRKEQAAQFIYYNIIFVKTAAKVFIMIAGVLLIAIGLPLFCRQNLVRPEKDGATAEKLVKGLFITNCAYLIIQSRKL